MKYNIGDSFYFEKTGITKKIIDFENFESVVVYYMNDVTSYSEDQLNSLLNPQIVTFNSNKRDFFKIIEENIEEIQKEYYRLIDVIINQSTKS
jgi:hypothetical protein